MCVLGVIRVYDVRGVDGEGAGVDISNSTVVEIYANKRQLPVSVMHIVL